MFFPLTFFVLIRYVYIMVRETWVQSQWYLITPCLTLSNIKYISRVKWSNPGKRVVPYTTPHCSSYWKGSLLVALNYGHQLYLLYLYPSLTYLSIYPCLFISIQLYSYLSIYLSKHIHMYISCLSLYPSLSYLSIYPSLFISICPSIFSYLPTPPLGLDMTKGQFLSRV